MRRLRMAIVLVLFASGARTADLDRARTEALAGDRAYEEADYAAAIGHYRSALEQGLDHADVHYNLGNAYYKHGELGRAIASYERALLRSPRMDSARANLDQARQLTRDEAFQPLSLPLFLRPLGAIYDHVSLNEWATSALLFAFLAALAVVLAQWWAPWRPRARAFVVAALVGVVVCGSMTILRSTRDLGRTRAVVTVDEAEVRSGPGSGYNVAFKVHEGLTVFVSDQREQWAQIHLGGQLVGWVPLSEIELL